MKDPDDMLSFVCLWAVICCFTVALCMGLIWCSTFLVMEIIKMIK